MTTPAVTRKKSDRTTYVYVTSGRKKWTEMRLFRFDFDTGEHQVLTSWAANKRNVVTNWNDRYFSGDFRQTDDASRLADWRKLARLFFGDSLSAFPWSTATSFS